MNSKQLSIVGHLDRCTVRIETDTGNVGTGFFFAATANGMPPGPLDPIAPLIITNNHVIDGASRLKMVLAVRNSNGVESNVGIDEPMSNLWRTKHPNGLDLTSISLVNVLQALEHRGLTFAGTWLDASIMPSTEKLVEIEPLSDVVMVGYPSEAWDKVHNKPIFRRGITASHPAIPWNGNPEFLIDTATYGGSSGSPVFAYSTGGFVEGGNFVIGGTRLLLIGVTRAVMLHTAEGEIRMVDIPAQQKAVPFLALPNNLGVCIQIEALTSLLNEAMKPRPPTLGWSARWG